MENKKHRVKNLRRRKLKIMKIVNWKHDQYRGLTRKTASLHRFKSSKEVTLGSWFYEGLTWMLPSDFSLKISSRFLTCMQKFLVNIFQCFSFKLFCSYRIKFSLKLWLFLNLLKNSQRNCQPTMKFFNSRLKKWKPFAGNFEKFHEFHNYAVQLSKT